jgi:hypothetical protein
MAIPGRRRSGCDGGAADCADGTARQARDGWRSGLRRSVPAGPRDSRGRHPRSDRCPDRDCVAPRQASSGGAGGGAGVPPARPGTHRSARHRKRLGSRCHTAAAAATGSSSCWWKPPLRSQDQGQQPPLRTAHLSFTSGHRVSVLDPGIPSGVEPITRSRGTPAEPRPALSSHGRPRGAHRMRWAGSDATVPGLGR